GLEAALAELALVDGRMGELWARTGTPDPRAREPGFETLLRTIVYQQLSTRAAATIWDRLCEACRPMTPETLLAGGDDRLRAAGLSRPKIGYARALAEAVTGEFDLEGVHRLPDEEAVARLVELRGIGRWSAECYLLFALDRQDIMPADDLGLATAVRRWLDLDSRPGPGELRELAEAWRPWRSAAARLLWHSLRMAAI
ncbi:MAG: DNA-3-methyladenine glycosylase family protein, partial [Alphaproteobacteria bacterium]